MTGKQSISWGVDKQNKTWERESSSQRLKVAGGWLGSYYYYWKILWLFAAHSVALKSKKWNLE